MRFAAFVLLLLAGSTNALKIAHKPKAMDAHKCKVMCQRFGMKALGPEFAQIHNPTECCQKCDAVYSGSSLVQLSAVPKDSPQPSAPQPAAVPGQEPQDS